LIYPETVTLNFQSSPPGLQLTVGTGTQVAPFARTVITGSAHSIAAPTPQPIGGVRYDFASWSDGGSQSHNIVANVNATYTATYLDITAPTRSNGSPSGILPGGTTQTSITLATNENAVCRYATTPNVAYMAMPVTFSTTGGTTHATSITGLTNGGSYQYYVRCQDGSNNSNADDFLISFG
jgi:hypothetical protein